MVMYFILIFYYDFKYQVIPNRLTIGALIVGWIIAFFNGSLIYSILTSLLGISLLLIPYIIGWVGGGDVKLLAAIGSLTNIEFMTNTLFYGLILAGILAFALLFYQGGFNTIINVFKFVLVKDKWRPTKMFIPLGSCVSVFGILLSLLHY